MINETISHAELVKTSVKALQEIGCTEIIEEYGIAKWRVDVVGIIQYGKLERKIAVECGGLTKEKEAAIQSLFDVLYHVVSEDDVKKIVAEWKRLQTLDVQKMTERIATLQKIINRFIEPFRKSEEKIAYLINMYPWIVEVESADDIVYEKARDVIAERYKTKEEIDKVCEAIAEYQRIMNGAYHKTIFELWRSNLIKSEHLEQIKKAVIENCEKNKETVMKVNAQ